MSTAANRACQRKPSTLATAATEAKLPDGMRQTRRKSVEVARRYMRSTDLWKNNVTE